MSEIYFSPSERDELRETCANDGDWGGTEWGAVILRLLDALEAPCGSCHPCSHYAAETWRKAGGELPHKYVVDEMRAKIARVDALADDWQQRGIPTWPMIADGRTHPALTALRGALDGPAEDAR